MQQEYNLANRIAVMATMHHKEQLLAPLFAEAFGMQLVAAPINTDLLGTFSGEVERPAPQAETLRRKCLMAIEQTQNPLAIASEGAFFPHPQIPWVYANLEMLMLIDQQNGLEISSQYLTTQTNFGYSNANTLTELEPFLHQVAFPEHALIVKTEGKVVQKGITDRTTLEQLAKTLWGQGKTIQFETDMRAMLNPTRQQAIRQAALLLIEKLRSHCPKCNKIGFWQTDVQSGLPCENCGLPTTMPQHFVWTCLCGQYQELRPNPQSYASAYYCGFCNP